MSCAVKECKNAKRFKPEGIHFHRFPKGRLLRAWKHALRLHENWQWSVHKFVCSEHFKLSDYMLIGTGFNRLKLNAVPFIKDETESSQCESLETSVIANLSRTSSTYNMGDSVLDSTSIAASSSLKGIIQTDSSSSCTSLSQSISHVRLKRKMSSDVMKRKIELKTSSPRKIKKKYTLLEESQSKMRRQLYTTKRTIKTLNKRITNLKTAVKELKQNQSLSEGAAFHLQKCYEDVPNILPPRDFKNI